MEAEKGQKESAPSWQFHEFVNTPMADHKACFKNTIDEMVENIRKEVHGLKGGDNIATS
ncbi:unnamed protein product [Withania somnifera]